MGKNRAPVWLVSQQLQGLGYQKAPGYVPPPQPQSHKGSSKFSCVLKDHEESQG